MTGITYAVNHCQALVSFRDTEVYQRYSLFRIPLCGGFYIIYVIILCLCNSARNKSDKHKFRSRQCSETSLATTFRGSSVHPSRFISPSPTLFAAFVSVSTSSRSGRKGLRRGAGGRVKKLSLSTLNNRTLTFSLPLSPVLSGRISLFHSVSLNLSSSVWRRC